MLPNFQGAVLDSVIQEDRSAFGSMMTYYIAFNLVQTCFGVCRRICFSIMGECRNGRLGPLTVAATLT